jgi:signal transduction histidine kinase
MGSLFSKIFLWFWLAMALVGTALFISIMTTRQDTKTPHFPEMIRDALAIYAQSAALICERNGKTAVADYFNRVEPTSHIQIFYFNENGEQITGSPAPPEVRELAVRTRQIHTGEIENSDNQQPQAQSILIKCGGVLIGRMMPRRLPPPDRPPRRPSLWEADPETQALRLLAVLITAGIVCYGLARYLTSPVVELRKATQQLADGNLTARVSAKMGNRRDELADLGRDFDVMAERIESLMNAQKRLLSDISHELRSPLARLNVALGLARQRADGAAKNPHDRIELEAERLNNMIGWLLTLTSLESGAEKLDKSPVDLEGLVEEIVVDANYEARNRNCSVRVINSERCMTSGSKELLRSAIENVVRNSIRYTRDGTEIEISLFCQHNGNDSQAVLIVRDHGEGVPETALSDIFRPFYRIADARDRQTGGVGLGLSITDRVVRSHNGVVKAYNAPNGGLAVEIDLPVLS